MIAFFGLLFSMLVGLEALHNGIRRSSIFALALMLALHFVGCGAPNKQGHENKRNKPEPTAENSANTPQTRTGQVQIQLDLTGNPESLALVNSPQGSSLTEDKSNLMKVNSEGELSPAFVDWAKSEGWTPIVEHLEIHKNFIFLSFRASHTLYYTSREDGVLHNIDTESFHTYPSVQVDGDYIYYLTDYIEGGGDWRGGPFIHAWRKLDTKTGKTTELYSKNRTTLGEDQWVVLKSGSLIISLSEYVNDSGLIKVDRNEVTVLSEKSAKIIAAPDSSFFLIRKHTASKLDQSGEITSYIADEGAAVDDFGRKPDADFSPYKGIPDYTVLTEKLMGLQAEHDAKVVNIIEIFPEYKITQLEYIDGAQTPPLNTRYQAGVQPNKTTANNKSVLAVAGTKGLTGKLIAYNLEDMKETDLLPDEDIDIYNVSIDNKRVYITGLPKRPGSFGLTSGVFSASINLETKEVKITPAIQAVVPLE